MNNDYSKTIHKIKKMLFQNVYVPWNSNMKTNPQRMFLFNFVIFRRLALIIHFRISTIIMKYCPFDPFSKSYKEIEQLRKDTKIIFSVQLWSITFPFGLRKHFQITTINELNTINIFMWQLTNGYMYTQWNRKFKESELKIYYLLVMAKTRNKTLTL